MRRNLQYDRLMSIVLLIGILLSLFLLYEKYDASASVVCTFGESFNCGTVSKSPYAQVDGIFYLMAIEYGWPVPLIDISGKGFIFDLLTSNSFLGFITLLFLFGLHITKKKFLFVASRDKDRITRIIVALSVLYAAYLLYIQHSILQTYCVFCIGLDFVILVAFILTLIKK